MVLENFSDFEFSSLKFCFKALSCSLTVPCVASMATSNSPLLAQVKVATEYLDAVVVEWEKRGGGGGKVCGAGS